MIYRFNDVSERDMDLLFVEEFGSSAEFANIFLKKLGISSAQIVEAELSKVSAEYGESDMTVIFQVDGKRYALLIENKIDAIAMPRQCQRYFKRGQQGIDAGEYESFDVFIIAPEKYLLENTEASKYPYHVAYEECVKYFSGKSDSRSQFKISQLQQAISKQKHSYQIIENKAVTDFWDKYITFKEQNYPELWLVSKRGPKGINASWPHFNTVLDNAFIYHKSEMGYVDLTIPGAADKVIALEKAFLKAGVDLKAGRMSIVKTGKSAAIRICVTPIDFRKPFEMYLSEVRDCFKAVVCLNDLAKTMQEDGVVASMNSLT